MPQFMLLIHEGHWTSLSPEQMQEVIGKFGGWVEQMRAAGVFTEGKKLHESGRVVRSHDGRLTDGPYTETKETIGGYFLIDADSIEQAVEIARGCPSFDHGGSVEVRPVDNPSNNA